MAKRKATSQIGKLTSDHKKSKINLIYLCVGDLRHIIEKLSTRAITLLWTSSQSKVYAQSYGVPKFRESQLWQCHLDVGLVEKHKYIIRGKVVASPKSEPWWVLWIWISPWLILAPKVFKLCTNQLLVWFCADQCEWLMLVILLSPISELQHAPLPLKVLRAKERAPIPCSFVVSLQIHIWVY
jgi:hypothetical protein